MFPLTALSKQAELMRGLTIPTSTVSTYKGSPLSAAATVASTIGGLAQPTYTIGPDGKVVAGPSVGGQIVGGITDAAKGAYNYVKDAFGGSSTSPIDASAGTPFSNEYTGIPTEYAFNSSSNYYTPAQTPSFDFNAGQNSNYSGYNSYTSPTSDDGIYDY
jgi:hypothetical protein